MPMSQLPPSLISLLVVALALVGCQRDVSLSDESASAPAQIKLAGEGEPAVELVVNYGDGAEKRFTRIPIAEGMTVLGALQFAADHPRGITFQKSGSGEAALLTKLDDLTNQGGGDDKNWIYRVNGKLASKSFDAYVLAPGDVILWRFEEYE
ncbi:MAG: DUF4430 domain-containing protein [Pirellulales bacterium]